MVALDAAGPAPEPLPLHVLTGFLGSGKTTLLNRLLQTPQCRDAAVLINEFGDIAVDHLLVREAREELLVLDSGCVCCSLRTDLVEQLAELMKQRAEGTIPAFSRIVLETTGLADPAPIVQTMLSHPNLRDALYLDGIVCVVDAELGAATLRKHDEARKQVAIADRLVVTKLDRVDGGALAELERTLRGESPGARVLHASPERDAAALLLHGGHLDTRSVWQRDEVRADHLGHVGKVAMTLEQPVDFRAFSLWVSFLTQLWADRILRLKAVVSARGEPTPIAVQAVQHVVYPPLNLPPAPELRGRTRVVVLIADLKPEERTEIETSLRALSA